MAKASRASSKKKAANAQENSDNDDNTNVEESAQAEDDAMNPPQQQGHRVPAHVREWQRAVAEREASRLARPEKRQIVKLKHADKSKSAVSSTPFGVNPIRRYADSDEEEEWCGPFSVARQMIAKREEAKRKREKEQEEGEEHHPLDAMMQVVEEENKKKAHPSMSWKSHIDEAVPASLYVKRQKRVEVIQNRQSRIPPLAELCIKFVVDNFEHVESLGDIPNDVRVGIAKELISQNKLDGPAFQALVEPTMETLELADCSGVPQEIMAKELESLFDLRYLLLNHAGRCFGPVTVNALLTRSKVPLVCLSISGAYILQDEDAAKIIEATSDTLSSLQFAACPLLGDKTIDSIIANCTDGNLLEVVFQDLVITPNSLQKLATQPTVVAPLRNVKSLTIQSMPGMRDDVVLSFLQVCGDSLESLNISSNLDLTDNSLSAIRQFNPRLRNLNIEGLRQLTAPGLEILFTWDIDGITTSPPKLKVLNAGSCDHELITDDVMKMVLDMGERKLGGVDPSKDGPSLPSRTGGLVQLDIQGSTLVTDITLETLAATCRNSLEDLNVSYCPAVTSKGLGYLVEKCGDQLSKMHTWGCAQLTDDFFDGHARVRDTTYPLEILGAWMKRSGKRSVR